MNQNPSSKHTNSLKSVLEITCGCGRSFTKRGYTRHKCEQSKEQFFCDFCKTAFTTERRLINHLCEQKRRFLQREDQSNRRGFMAYERFYNRSMGKSVTYENFMKSSLYGAFVRFGKHCIDVNVLNLLGFVDFLLRVEAPVDKWTNLTLYDTYVRELNKTEPPIDALERVFKVMQQWAIESDENWIDFFRKVQPPLAALWISNGKISPWVLFTASSAHDLLKRLPPEQIAMVEKAIDPVFWKLKIERHQNEVEIIRSILAEYGI